MEVHTSATQARRYEHSRRERSVKDFSYQTRMELARNWAASGAGWEDLHFKLNISERDARYLVFGRNE